MGDDPMALKGMEGALKDYYYYYDTNTVNVAAMPAQLRQHAVQLLLMADICRDVTQRCRSCLVQPAVGPGGTEQAALVIGCTAL